MFNLEQAIANWRSSLVQAGSSPEVIDELECHLRDEIESQMRTVSDPQSAFDNAVLLMGDPVQLEQQFKKASIADEKTRGSIPFSSLVKVAAVLSVPFAIMLLLSSFRVFDLQRNILGILVGWLIFTAGTLSTLVIIFRVTKIPVLCRAVVAIDPFPASSLQSPLLLEHARAEALALGHDFIGTEHLLLALLKENPRVNNPAANLDYQSVRSEVIRLISPNTPHPISTRLPLTPRATKALQIAAKESKRQKHPTVTADDILSGLIHEGHGVAAKILHQFRLR
jgi:hypothetical protein